MKVKDVPGIADRELLNPPGKICTVDAWGRVSVGSEHRGKRVIAFMVEATAADLGPFQKQ